MTTQTPLDFVALIEPVAKALLGEPNPKLTTAKELRYGTNGSLSIDLAKATFYDHERQEGGGLLALICRCLGYADDTQAVDWLMQQGLQPSAPAAAKPRLVATYDYRDEAGALAFQVVRLEPKSFRQRCPDVAGRGWNWSVKGCRVVPYRLPDLLEQPSAPVFIVEGEKDADRLYQLGLVATCNAGGAGKWRPEHSAFLQGRDVVVLPDNDQAGQDHARLVFESLQGIAASVKVLALPGLPPKGDVSDWLGAGGTASELLALAAATAIDAPAAPAAQQKPPSNRRSGFFTSLDMTTLDDVPDIDFVLADLVPRGVVTLLAGHGGTGKSTLALQLGLAIASGQDDFLGARIQAKTGKSVFVSLEDSLQVCAVRLKKMCTFLEIEPGQLNSSLIVLENQIAPELSAINFSALKPTDAFKELHKLCINIQPDLIIIDNASDAFAGSEINRQQVRGFIRQLAGLAKECDAGLILLAHVDKQTSRGMSGAGSESYSGSTAWHNSVRSRVFLSREGASQMLTLEHQKSNYGALREKIVCQFDGFTFEAVSARQDENDIQALVDLIALYAQRGISISTSPRAHTTNVPAVLSREEKYPSHRSKKDILRLLQDAQSAKLLVQEDERGIKT